MVLPALAGLLATACAGPEDPTAAADNTAPATATETDGEADAAATTADGELDFSAIEGDWSGTVDGVIFGQNHAGTVPLEMHIDGSAERSSQVGTLDWFTTAGEIECAVTLSAIDATPPRYEVRERVPQDHRENCAAGRITLSLQPGGDTLEFKGRWRDVTFEGVLNRTGSA